MNGKLVIIINGVGGTGKDALIQEAESQLKIRNVSSIDCIKRIATFGGWDGVKDDKGRYLLAKMKDLFTEYNNLPFNDMINEYNRFLASPQQVLFIHIREPKNIDSFKAAVPCKTMLITRDGSKVWAANGADDEVENYNYDYYYENNKPLEESGKLFVKGLLEILNGKPNTVFSVQKNMWDKK